MLLPDDADAAELKEAGVGVVADSEELVTVTKREVELETEEGVKVEAGFVEMLKVMVIPRVLIGTLSCDCASSTDVGIGIEEVREATGESNVPDIPSILMWGQIVSTCNGDTYEKSGEKPMQDIVEFSAFALVDMKAT